MYRNRSSEEIHKPCSPQQLLTKLITLRSTYRAWLDEVSHSDPNQETIRTRAYLSWNLVSTPSFVPSSPYSFSPFWNSNHRIMMRRIAS